MTTPVDASGAALGSILPVTNYYDYDGMGRLVKEVDNYRAADPISGLPDPDPTANRTTTYGYVSVASTGTTTSILNPRYKKTYPW